MTKFETICEIYDANKRARDRFLAVLESVTDDEAAKLPDDRKWSIQQIVEHVAIVDGGAARICQKLLDDVSGMDVPSQKGPIVSEEFLANTASAGSRKLEAPERVHPTGDVSVAEAIERLRANDRAFDAMRPDLETADLTAARFSHPYFGELNAAEWLVIKGGHEARHTSQVERLLAVLRA